MAKDNTIKIDDHNDGTYTVWGDQTTLRQSVYCRSKSDLLDYLTKLLSKGTAFIPDSSDYQMTATGSQIKENAVTKEEEIRYQPDLKTPLGRMADFFHRHNEKVNGAVSFIYTGIPVNEYNALRVDFLKLTREHELETDRLNDQVTKLQKELKNLHFHHVDKTKHLEKQLAEIRSTDWSLHGAFSALQWFNRYNESQRKLKELQKELEEIRGTTTKPVHQALMDQEREIRQFKDRITVLESDLKQYEGINDGLRQEVSVLTQANENWSKINHEENMEAGRSIEHLSNTIAKKNLVIEGLQKEVNSLRESLNRAMAAVERAKKAVDEYYG